MTMRNPYDSAAPVASPQPVIGCGVATPVPELTPDAALMLDFDGTLAPFAPRPERVVVAPYLSALLLRVRSHLRGALALISGRKICDLDRLTGWSVMATAGVHGLERRNANGILVRAAAADGRIQGALRADLDAFRRGHPDVIVEDKGISIALHYRLAPNMAEACGAFAESTVSKSDDFEIVQGNQVIEIKPRAENKGSAVRAFLNEHPFKGRRPVFVGDDLTDEHAFAEVRRHGGISVIVGDRAPTLAEYRLANVHAVHAWLNTIHG